jgi:hypothetical protein
MVYCPGICPERLRKTTNNLIDDSLILATIPGEHLTNVSLEHCRNINDSMMFFDVSEEPAALIFNADQLEQSHVAADCQSVNLSVCLSVLVSSPI